MICLDCHVAQTWTPPAPSARDVVDALLAELGFGS